MALPSSGAISLSAVNTELGLSSTAAIGLNDAAVRSMFEKSSGAISLSDGYGKAAPFGFSIASNQANVNIRSLAVAAGWGEVGPVTATINSGVIVYSSSTGSYALTVNGSFPFGVSIVNNGTVIGAGGGGGAGIVGNGGNGSAGGPALLASVAVTITNNNRISGGGGGGGAGSGHVYGAAGGNGGTGIGLSAATAGDPGGEIVTPYDGTWYGGAGGAGGTYGASGASGASAAGYSPGSGGAGGNAVSGDANITWSATGTRNGGIVS